MPKVDEGTARAELLKIAAAFGSEQDGILDLMPYAMEGRVYLEGEKVVFVLQRPIALENGDFIEKLSFREAMASDYSKYSEGMSVLQTPEGVKIDAVIKARRVMKCVSQLADQPIGVVGRLGNRDLQALQDFCPAIGFFE